MATELKGKTGAIVDLTAAAIHNWSTSTNITLTEYDNTDGYLRGTFELLFDSTAPAAGVFVALYLLVAPDGTNYSTTNSVPLNVFVGNFVFQNVANGRYHIVNVELPLCKFKPYLRNETVVATDASGSHFKLLPTRYQSV